jgi:hypothetical protein
MCCVVVATRHPQDCVADGAADLRELTHVHGAIVIIDAPFSWLNETPPILAHCSIGLLAGFADEFNDHGAVTGVSGRAFIVLFAVDVEEVVASDTTQSIMEPPCRVDAHCFHVIRLVA